MTQDQEIIIYTDGGSDPNPGYGGWGAILCYGTVEKELSGSAPHTTNNRMELTAALEALRTLKRPCTIQLYTDSQYLRRGITEWIAQWQAKNWRRSDKSPVENADLWQALLPETQRHTIEWHWVKGHAGNAYNERVDKLATAARLAITPMAAVDTNQPLIYARASYLGKKDVGGWGVVLIWPSGEQVSLNGRVAHTTNNRMELTAVLEGLRQIPAGTAAQIFTVSDYVFQGATQWLAGWRKRNWQKKEGEPIANADLWQELDQLMRNGRLRWLNAKGQQEPHPALQAAAKLASEAASDPTLSTKSRA